MAHLKVGKALFQLAVLAEMFALGVAAAGAMQTGKDTDSTVVDPKVHKVVLENEHVRVLEATSEPGAKSARHTHPPMVFIAMRAFKAKAMLPDGSTRVLEFKPGQVLWLGDVDHSWELLEGQVHVIGVEVKSAQKK